METLLDRRNKPPPETNSETGTIIGGRSRTLSGVAKE